MKMKYFFLFFLCVGLVGCSSIPTTSGKRNWTLYNSSEALGTKTYIDYSTIEVNDHLRSFWTLINSSSPVINAFTNQPYFSSLSKDIVNCSNQSLANIAYYHYSEPFASGKLIYKMERDSKELRFESGRPRSGLEQTILKICSTTN